MNPFTPLLDQFHHAYPGHSRVRLCHAPGRVNLIGEHIDYSGLPVLPMTVNRFIRVAYALREDDQLCMASADEAFPRAAFSIRTPVPPSSPGAWENYCKAAVEGINRGFKPIRARGMDMLIAGDIPKAAGLSSSSALVVACALAYLDAVGLRLEEDLSRIELAELLAEAEQYVGTRGGGMDQAIILLGEPGHACAIHFHPIRVECVPLFPGHSFVVLNSGVKAAKSGEALHRYNEGPLSCRLLRALVERQAREEFDDSIVLERLGDLWFGDLCLTHREVEGLVDRALPGERVPLRQASAILGIDEHEIRRRWLGDLKEPDGGFPLKARARHQLSEYRRVERARDMLLANDPRGFGELMNASHDSCAGDYAVSCEELDRLVAVARGAGAIGARLTGAGFGGCTVNLVPDDTVSEFLEQVKKAYYAAWPAERARDAVLVVEAADKAGYAG